MVPIGKRCILLQAITIIVIAMNNNLTLDPNIAQMLNAYGEEKANQVQNYLDHPEKIPAFMDFRVDYAFKYILGHKPVLLKLINDILPVQVSDIEYLPNEIPVISPKEKRAAFDVICTTRNSGERFITEMQCLPDLDMDDRLLFYGSSLLHSQVKRGSKTYQPSPVYVLCVADYERRHVELSDPGQFFFGYQLREQSNHNDIFTHQLQYFFLELPRLRKKWEKLETNAERWCYLFGNLNNFAKIPQNTAGFDDVFALAQTGELDGKELKKYINSMLDEYTVYTTTEYARQEGIKEGIEKGEKNGIQKVARKMLARHDSIDSIVEVTGLSPEAVQALQTQPF